MSAKRAGVRQPKRHAYQSRQAARLDQVEAKKVLAAAEGLRNSARWSVCRQGEPPGLRWEYVNLDTWWQLQRNKWQHGCDDPHACGARLRGCRGKTSRRKKLIRIPQ
jgi:hypothetical protein